MTEFGNLPSFEDLPEVEGLPHGCTWGLFDRNGTKDLLGCLNLLSPSVVREALKEAHDGVTISLNWTMAPLEKGLLGRKSFQHNVIDLKKSHMGIHAFDDETFFNTQGSSQWDSLVHFGHQATGLFYNGVKPTRDTLMQRFGQEDTAKQLPTLNHWHDRGGILGRGVLLDYKAFADKNGIHFDPFDSHGISVDVLEKVKKAQGSTFKYGDILLIRTGFIEALSGLTAEEQERCLSTHKAVGVKTCKESAKWLWNLHPAAVACDTIGFEQVPPIPPKEESLSTSYTSQSILLPQIIKAD